MSGLDEFYPDLSTTDTKKKLTVGVNIVNYLKDENNPLDCEDIGGFIDGLVPWMQSSNFKVRSGVNLLPAGEILRLYVLQVSQNGLGTFRIWNDKKIIIMAPSQNIFQEQGKVFLQSL